MKELARKVRSTFSAGDFHSVDHILAAPTALFLDQTEARRA